MANQSASFTKLRDGDWGARISFPAIPIKSGQTVEVTKKSGEVALRVVESVLWIGADNKTGDPIVVVTLHPGKDHVELPPGTKTINRRNGPPRSELPWESRGGSKIYDYTEIDPPPAVTDADYPGDEWCARCTTGWL